MGKTITRTLFTIVVSLTSIGHGADRPNILLILVDDVGYCDIGAFGARLRNTSADELFYETPRIDQLARQGTMFTQFYACTVCAPTRASLMTGQYPLTHQVIYNDKALKSDAVCIADVYKEAGYQTAYIGKWHINGDERSAFIPKERRQGFDYWKVLECTHDYNNSWYWDNDDQKKKWEGYDAIAQTNDAIGYLKKQKGEDPFILFLSWG